MFSCEFCETSKTLPLQNTSRRLLLYKIQYFSELMIVIYSLFQYFVHYKIIFSKCTNHFEKNVKFKSLISSFKDDLWYYYICDSYSILEKVRFLRNIPLNYIYFDISLRSSHQRCSIKKLRPTTLFEKEALAQVCSCEFCKFFKNTFFTEHLWMTASDLCQLWTSYMVE